MKSPNPATHLAISLVKSGLRITAGVALALGNYLPAGVFLIIAEILGIAEELF